MAQPDESQARGYNEAEIAAAEEQFDALMNAGITAAVAAMVAAILAEPIPSMVSNATLQPLFTLWNAYTADVLVPELTRIYMGSAGLFVETAELTLLALSYELTDIAPLDEPAAAWMSKATVRLRNVGNIVWEEIREQLTEGIEAGDGIPELAIRVEQAAGFSAIRARLTARTEVAAASNGGAITQARALDLDMDKQWEATVPTDGRTRPTHLAAHHQTVPLGAMFEVGDSQLDFPGDPTGEAKESCNCRCAVTFVNIRRREESPTVAAGFVETQHPRDREGKFADTPGDGGADADFLEIDDAMTQLGDTYSRVVSYWEWGTHTGAEDGIEGYASVHENGETVLSYRDQSTGKLHAVAESDDPQEWRQLAQDIEWAIGAWEADTDAHEGWDDHDLLDSVGDETSGIAVGYGKNGDINIVSGDDIWLAQEEADSLVPILALLADSIDDNPEMASGFSEAKHPRDREGQLEQAVSDKPETASAATHTGAMIALVPTGADVERLALDGGEPADELHLTVMYLGDAAEIDSDAQAAVHAMCAELARGMTPIEGDGFAVNVFNPHTEDRETALVMGVGGDGLAEAYTSVSQGVGKLVAAPKQHVPFVPHVTLAYTDDLGRLPDLIGRLGPVSFDRLRVAFGDDVIDYPLTGSVDNSTFDAGGFFATSKGKIRIAQPGGFRRCVRALRDEPGVTDPEGLCATLHHRATGKWPGETRMTVVAAAGESVGVGMAEMYADQLAYEDMIADAVPGAMFHTLMHSEGVSTGRRVQMPGSLTWRTPPIPFNWQIESGMHGGQKKVIEVGLVTDIARYGTEIHGWGLLDLDDPRALEYARKLAEGWIRGVSVGMDESPMEVEYLYSPRNPDEVIQEVYRGGNIMEVTSSGGIAQEAAYVEPLPALIEALAARGIEVASADGCGCPDAGPTVSLP